MEAKCSECGFVYEREQGYFLGATSFSYIFSFFATLPLFLWLLFTDKPMLLVVGLPGLQAMLMAPFAFRLSRQIWIKLDYKTYSKSS